MHILFILVFFSFILQINLVHVVHFPLANTYFCQNTISKFCKYKVIKYKVNESDRTEWKELVG